MLKVKEIILQYRQSCKKVAVRLFLKIFAVSIKGRNRTISLNGMMIFSPTALPELTAIELRNYRVKYRSEEESDRSSP